ncbi:MAG: ribonuclease HII [Pseudomonadota bacterium]
MKIAGVDEAGRGPLAGPVFAAAVVLNENKPIVGITDSKKLSAKKRENLFSIIQEEALAWSISQAEVEEIDRLNIFQATMLAMKRAVESLNVTLDKVLVDGKHTPNISITAEAIVKGDLSEPCIGAASILAKVARDRDMLVWHDKHPEYGFADHKGYPTKKHREAIEKYGVLDIHRRSFRPVARCIELN